MQTVFDILNLEEDEQRTRGHDWSDQISGGPTLSTVTVTATDLNTSLSAASVVVGSSTANDITTFTVRRVSGAGVTPYSVDLRMVRTDNEAFIDHYLLGTEGTVYGLMEDAWSLLGLKQLGEVMPSEIQLEFLRALNQMLKSWSAKKTNVPSIARESFALVAGTNSYTIGATGTFATIRPKEVTAAFIRRDSKDEILDILTREEYDRIYDKSASRKPEALYYEPGFPLGRIYLDCAPDQADTLFIKSFKEMTTYSTPLAAHGLEGEYEEAIKWNLAVRRAAAHGIVVTPDMAAMAGDSLNLIRTLRQRNVTIQPLRLEVSAIQGQENYSDYDITTGQW